MGNVIFNVSKGNASYWATLPAATDSIIVVPLEASGLVADATMVDYDTLAAVLAGASNEQETMGRKTLTDVTVTVNDTDDRVEIDAANPSWTSTAGNATGALLFAYKPASDSTDDAIIPLSVHTWAYTPDGNNVEATLDSSGFYRTA
jgi:hypothetical protein